MIRPIWYLYEPADGAQRGILMLGNPAVMWGGLVAVAGCRWAGGARAIGGAGGRRAAVDRQRWGMWALIPKILGFFYYYYLPQHLRCRRARRRLPPLRASGRESWDEGSLVGARSGCSSISSRSSPPRRCPTAGVPALDVVRQLAWP